MVQDKRILYQELGTKLKSIADIIGADHDEIPFMADNSVFGRSFVEIEDGKYLLKRYDYGYFQSCQNFTNVDDLIFEIASNLISSVVFMKMKGFDNGKEHNDREFRGRLFELYEEYAGKISEDFKYRMKEKVKSIVERHPFRNGL